MNFDRELKQDVSGDDVRHPHTSLVLLDLDVPSPERNIDLRFLHPVPESLGIDAQPLTHPGDRATRIPGLRTQLEDHLHRAFPQLRGMRLP